MPVIYITQVIGLAMGIPAKELGLNQAFCSGKYGIINLLIKEYGKDRSIYLSLRGEYLGHS